ncbi:MAG: hypothetical protein Q9224_004594 [Gallowayella concinna]
MPDAVGEKAHIVYRDSSQVEPGGCLLKATEYLLATWLQAPKSRRREPGRLALRPAQLHEHLEDTNVLLFKQKLASLRIRNPGLVSDWKKATKHQLETHSTSGPEVDASTLPNIGKVGIRQHLKLWQEQRNQERSEAGAANSQPSGKLDTPVTRPSEDDASNILETADSTPHDYLNADNTTEVDDDGVTDHQSYLRTGDVVAFRTQHDLMLAIFVRQVGSQAQFYNVQGRWLQQPIRKVAHAIPRMFSLPEVKPILPYLPLEEINNDELDQLDAVDASVPRSIGAGLVHKLQAFHRESAEVYRDNAERIDGLHPLVAHEWKSRELSLLEIASIVLQKPDSQDLTEAMLFTIHKAITQNSSFCSLGNWIDPLWKVNPLKQIRDYEQVKQWLRDHLEVVIEQATSSEELSARKMQDENTARSNPVPRFIRKARNLIRKSRVHREVTTDSSIGLRPRKIETGSPDPDALITISNMTVFDADERMIIDYLKEWALSMDMPPIRGTWSLSPMLLRAIGMYEGHDLNPRTGALLLKELGIIAPWENNTPYRPILRHLPYKGDPEALRHWNVASQSASSFVSNGGLRKDSLEGLRKDWGDMNVYCIDSPGAADIDDGVSVEKIEGQDSRFWIHIHIASPAAFIMPGSDIAQSAAMLSQSLYLPEKVYPMLDRELSQRCFSLANDRPVLTFSAEITTDGEILTKKVTPGWIRKTKRITQGRIGRELGLNTGSRPLVSHSLTVGQPLASEKHTTSKETPLSISEISELRLLCQLALARRLKYGVANLPRAPPVPEPIVYIQPGGMAPTFSQYCGRQFIGDPTISWKPTEWSLADAPVRNHAREAVESLMIIAGETAAQWCGERNIPIPYRGTVRNPSLATTPEAFQAEVLNPVRNEMGYIPLLYRNIHFVVTGGPTIQSSPLPHGFLNVDAYARVTSPLRRYTDMIAHWQIQAALRHEALYGDDSLIGSTDDTYLPFSRAKIDAMLPAIVNRERRLSTVLSRSNRHWVMQLLHRAFHYKQAPLPAVFDVLVNMEKAMLPDPHGEALASVRQFSSFDTELIENDVSKQAGGIRLGDWWEARIERVDASGFQTMLQMVPVRLTERQGTDITKKFGSGANFRMC